jgi:hypothetical protein
MAENETGKQPLNEGYEPLQKGYGPRQNGYSPAAEKRPISPPKGGSGVASPPISNKK